MATWWKEGDFPKRKVRKFVKFQYYIGSIYRFEFFGWKKEKNQNILKHGKVRIGSLGWNFFPCWLLAGKFVSLDPIHVVWLFMVATIIIWKNVAFEYLWTLASWQRMVGSKTTTTTTSSLTKMLEATQKEGKPNSTRRMRRRTISAPSTFWDFESKEWNGLREMWALVRKQERRGFWAGARGIRREAKMPSSPHGHVPQWQWYTEKDFLLDPVSLINICGSQ